MQYAATAIHTQYTNISLCQIYKLHYSLYNYEDQ